MKTVAQKVKEWRLRNVGAWNCHKKVFSALRAGRLQKGVCPCGEIKVEAHHEDYRKPLQIIWLCKKHHIEADLKRRSKIK